MSEGLLKAKKHKSDKVGTIAGVHTEVSLMLMDIFKAMRKWERERKNEK